jgi:hypothetical protein
MPYTLELILAAMSVAVGVVQPVVVGLRQSVA